MEHSTCRHCESVRKHTDAITSSRFLTKIPMKTNIKQKRVWSIWNLIILEDKNKIYRIFSWEKSKLRNTWQIKKNANSPKINNKLQNTQKLIKSLKTNFAHQNPTILNRNRKFQRRHNYRTAKTLTDYAKLEKN